MQKADLISGFVLLLFGVALAFYFIPTQINESTDATISPRLLPQICAYALIFLSAIQLLNTVRASRAQSKGEQEWPVSPAEMLAMGAITVVFIVCIYLFNRFGPLVPGLLIVLTPMLFMGERRVLWLVLIPGTLVLAAYGLIYQVLGTSLQ